MGNTATKEYGQVSTIDDNKSDSDANLTFVFHTTEDDCTDRVVHNNELFEDFTTYTYSIARDDGQIIAARDDFDDRQSIDELLALLDVGDVVEFITSDHQSQWVVYTGHNSAVYLQNNKIIKGDLAAAYGGCPAKLVNNVYTLKALPIVQVVENAENQVGKATMWSNSECFAMWCRTGDKEFTNASQLSGAGNGGKQNYELQLKTGGEELTKSFTSLSKLIEFRKKMELPYNKGLNSSTIED